VRLCLKRSLFLLQNLTAFLSHSPGDGHSFPMRSMNESQNPLLANEEPWEDNEDDNRGELSQKKVFSMLSRPRTKRSTLI
jgi:hypothetical protein